MAGSAGELIVQAGGAVVQTVVLAPGVLTIGRLPDNGLRLEDAQVSRRHAEVRVEGGAAVVTDLGRSNGTFIGGTRLLPNQPHPLADGAVVEIGSFSLVYRAPGAVSHDTAIDLPDAAPPAPEPSPEPAAASPDAAAPAPAPAQPAPAASPAVPPPEPPPERARPRFPHPLPEASQSGYLRDLPVIFHDNEFLGRFLLLFETIWEPLEQRQDHIEMYFDPRTCPVTFLPWLARWLDLSFNNHWPESRRRRLLTEATDLYRWRGTRYGLTRMIEVCTGLQPEIRDDPAQPFLFHVRVALPRDGGIRRELIDELIRAHKPAHAGYTLEVE